MKLLFSEAKSDYEHYIFPYAIWAFPESGETPAQFFGRGFLPSSPNLDRFYLCRSLRVDLGQFVPSSENRRILRRCSGIVFRLLDRDEFDYNPTWRTFCKEYADIRFGRDVMTFDRLDRLFGSKITSHVLLYRDMDAGQDVGVVTLYLEPPDMAYYYYAFYDLSYYRRNLGMYMMTSAVKHFCEKGFHYVYLGSCYTRNALYKTQFRGAEFYTGFRWSSDLSELKYLIDRDQGPVGQHLLETGEYLERFYPVSVREIASTDGVEASLEIGSRRK